MNWLFKRLNSHTGYIRGSRARLVALKHKGRLTQHGSVTLAALGKL
ncbi:hypothetical protein HanPSC8_Chr05g0190001 [Helianthus annuus]|nr:hypothetical protein HanPSC8_Chr05g0190001 [Helianthus annuus]